MKVLVTGANGFVGRGLCQYLVERGDIVCGTVRRANTSLLAGVEAFLAGEIGPDTDWTATLQGVDALVHLAARVHLTHEMAFDKPCAYRAVNTEGTLSLARQAAAAGVRRFVFVSSIKVNGEGTAPGQSFMEKDQPAPQDAYAISKWAAEQGLRELAEKTGLELVVIRPSLVYGPGVKANFKTMMQWLNRGVPLPFGAIYNSRSLVALDNLVDMIVTCLDHPAAANQTFLVADDEDLSTTELLKRMSIALGKAARLFPISQNILKTGLRLIGKGDLAQRLCGSLQVDISKARILLGWTPPVSVDESLVKTARYFLDSQAIMKKTKEHAWN